MNVSSGKAERLSDHAARWRSALRAGDTGPLQIAHEVVRVCEAWEQYRADAGGIDATAWLRRSIHRGRGLPWYSARANAVHALGRHVANNLHHEVAVWIHRSVPEEFWKPCVEALVFARKKNGGSPLSPMQARRIVVEITGKKPAQRAACAKCAELTALLKKNGIEVPE